MKLSIFVFFVLLIVATSFDFNTLQFHVGNLKYFIDFPSLLIDLSKPLAMRVRLE